jgi:type IV pilus assembly protein PilA
MRRILRGVRHGQKGFTLIELLIVVAILGVIAAVVIPNVTAFMGSASVNAANTEVQNLRTAALGYYADHSTDANPWPADETALADYVVGDIVGTYSWAADGTMTGLTYAGMTWDVDQWIQAAGP